MASRAERAHARLARFEPVYELANIERTNDFDSRRRNSYPTTNDPKIDTGESASNIRFMRKSSASENADISTPHQGADFAQEIRRTSTSLTIDDESVSAEIANFDDELVQDQNNIKGKKRMASFDYEPDLGKEEALLEVSNVTKTPEIISKRPKRKKKGDSDDGSDYDIGSIGRESKYVANSNVKKRRGTPNRRSKVASSESETQPSDFSNSELSDFSDE
jgi:hypothetical protein